MKRLSCLIALVLALSFLLCSCENNQKKIIGTWVHSGEFEILGASAPFESAEKLIFYKDGTLVAVVNSTERTFRYVLTDDTLTIQGNGLSHGIGYQLNGDTLSIRTGRTENTEFKRVG